MNHSMNKISLSNYPNIDFPIQNNQPFISLTKSEIESYYEWFMQIKNERLLNFSNFFFKEPENSLDDKNLKVIDTILISTSRIEPFSLNHKSRTHTHELVLDKKTLSLCFDIGIYLGELMIINDKKIIWKLEKDIKFAYYGQPVLIKKGIKSDINPFAVVKNMAAKIIKNIYTEYEIIDVYSYWKKIFHSL